MHSIKDLYEFLQKHNDTSIIPWLSNPWQGIDKQESLIRVFALCRLIPLSEKYKLCEGNFNKGTITICQDYKQLFHKSLSNKGDASDLTLLSTDGNELIATTSKNTTEYNINSLDISQINDIHHQKYNDKKLKLMVIVRDKTLLFHSIQRSETSSQHIKNQLLDKNTLIFDWNDLDNWYKNFKILSQQSINQLFANNKQHLALKFHQQLAVIKTIILKNQNQKEILWGHIPRRGKSYIVAGRILADKGTDYIIVTTAPAETIEQFMSLFNQYSEFDDYNIQLLNSNWHEPQKAITRDDSDEEISNPILDSKSSSKNIYIASKQFLQTKLGKNVIPFFKNKLFNIMFIDESHNGGTTELAQSVIKTYTSQFVVYITATYTKPIVTFNIPKSNWILWDIEDIKLCQKIHDPTAKQILSVKHGEEFVKLLNANIYSQDNIVRIYKAYPDFMLMTSSLTVDAKKILKNAENVNGLSFNKLFLLKQNASTTIPELQNEHEFVLTLEMIFGDTSTVVSSKNNIMGRIQKVVNDPAIRSRFFRKNNPLSIMMFLPCGLKNGPIDMIQAAVENVIKKLGLLKDYKVISINSKCDYDSSKKYVDESYIETKNLGKKGLIILSGKQCSLGVSFNHCDIVILMNNTESYDAITQMSFRSMTEAPGKKCGFVIDLNVKRAVNMVINCAMRIMERQSTEVTDLKSAVKYVLKNNMMNFNCDECLDTIYKLDCDDNNLLAKMVTDLCDVWQSDPENNIKHLLDRLSFDSSMLSKEDYIHMHDVFSALKNQKVKDKTVTETLIDEEKLNNLTEKKENDKEEICKRKDKDSKEDDKSNKYNRETEEFVDLWRNIIKHIIPLLCMLTIHDDCHTFDGMLVIIAFDKKLLELFSNQIELMWGEKTKQKLDIKWFIFIYNKYFIIDNAMIKNTVAQIKQIFIKAAGDKSALSKLVDTYLVPQNLEKLTNAEVSTPYHLRQDMLNMISSGFWKNPAMKVFEPCVGKGAFLLDIIDRFMKGLTTIIEDDELRYKHIVENMVYFADINPMNIYICQLLLDPKARYKLNYNCGDTLELDIQKKWNIVGFYAVIGNPPYNASGGIATGNTIWQKFVTSALNNWIIPGWILAYVHPSGWRKPNSDKGKFNGLFEIMARKNNVMRLEIHGMKDGLKTFNCGTRYDFYVIRKYAGDGTWNLTHIRDEYGKRHLIDLRNWYWLPNGEYEKIDKLLARGNDKMCDVIYDRNSYDVRRQWMNHTKTKENIYPVINSTTKNGPVIYYSSRHDKGIFGVKKVIIGESGINTPILDIKGIYGVTQNAFAIKIDSEEEAIALIKGLTSQEFQKIIKACMWSTFRVEHNLFKYIKKDFYKYL